MHWVGCPSPVWPVSWSGRAGEADEKVELARSPSWAGVSPAHVPQSHAYRTSTLTVKFRELMAALLASTSAHV